MCVCVCVCIHTQRSEEQLLAFWRAATAFLLIVGLFCGYTGLFLGNMEGCFADEQTLYIHRPLLQKKTYTTGAHSQNRLHNPLLQLQHTATHCNTLQHTATHYNTLHHTTSYCHSATHCNTHCNTHTTTRCIPIDGLRRRGYMPTAISPFATHCNTLQHNLQHVLQHFRLSPTTWIHANVD